MVLQSITLSSFRNFASLELVPGRRFNVFHGRNGQGKTNLLEAVFLAGTMKSFRHARNGDLIRWGEPFALVKARVDRDGTRRDVALVVEKEGKKARVDGKHPERLSDFFGILNVVVFSPEEMGMARGAPESRRRFLDRAVFSADPCYLARHQEYGKILRNRNALLRSGCPESLETWSERLAEAGARVYEARIRYLRGISELFRSFHAAVAGGEEASVAYRSPHSRNDADPAEYGESLLRALTEKVEEETRRGATLAGPHRDDLDFRICGKPLAQFGSQGQVRTFVLALKMAEIACLDRTHGTPPVLLLDDIGSELDSERKRNLMHFLEEREMQVFLTTTGMENLPVTEGTNYRTFLVEGATVR